MSSPTAPRVLSRRALRLPCLGWEGRPSEYQGEAKAAIAYKLGAGREVPWVYVVPYCGTQLCLQSLHLRWFRATRVAYPAYVCVYCGLPGYTKDHLLPVTMTGEAQRKFVAVVPACKECNSAIGPCGDHRVLERRKLAHEHIRKRYRKHLEDQKRWSPAELAELGPNLRSKVEESLQRGEVVRQRLAWPWDPEYDKRAFQKSGFEDPIAMELL